MKKMDYKLWVSVVALALGLSGCIITENGTNDVVVSEDNASSIQQPSSSISASSSETVSSAIDIPISSGVDVSSAVAMSSDGVLSSAVPTSSSVGILGSSSSVVVPVGGIHGIVINEAGAPLSNVSVQLEGPAVGGGALVVLLIR